MDYKIVFSLAQRNISLTLRNLDRLLNLFYWPVLNIVVWGLTSIWVQQTSSMNNFLLVFLTILIFWQITLRSAIDVSKNLLDEILSKNLINLFIAPLSLNEWILSSIISSSFTAVVLILFSSLIVYLLYSMNIFTMGFISAYFIALLTMCGWSIGFVLCGLVIWLGRKGSDLLFTLGWFIAPFCAVYAPLNVLPKFMQNIGLCFPMTYIFENVRLILINNKFSYYYAILALILSAFYLILSILFFKKMFAKAKRSGLASIE